MSAGPETAPSGASARPVTGGGHRPSRTGSPAGVLLGRLSLLPPLLAMAWLLAGLPLLLAGHFTPLPALLLFVPVAAVLLFLGLRGGPGRWPGALPWRREEAAATPWWAVAGVAAVAIGFGAFQFAYHSQQIIIQRDPASYVQFAAWLAGHGSLPIPEARGAFGTAAGSLNFASPAFFQAGHSVVPQFMAGLPMVLAGGFWIGGAAAATALAPVLGAGAVLTFGGLAARLTGPRWAPLAALALALSMPEQFTSRSTYTEPLAQILFLGGLCLVIDALGERRTAAAVMAALGGLALGITILVRIDGASDILPVIPYCGLLFVARRRQAMPLLAGLLVGGLLGGAEGLLLSRPYLQLIRGSLVPLALLGGAAVIGTALGMALLSGRGLPRLPGWAPTAVAVLPFAALLVFTARAYLANTHRPGHLAFHLLHHTDGLSLRWVFWYAGVPAVVLGTAAAAVLARRCLRGEAPIWTLPLMSFGWIIVTVLYRPAITPDQPWASRRLVDGVLPGFILLATWALGWLAGWLREHGIHPAGRYALVAACSVALVLPAAVTTFGPGITTGGRAGIGLTADGLGLKKTYAGEIAAVGRVCAAIPGGRPVVIVDPKAARRFTQVVRGMCGNPTAAARDFRPASIGQVISRIRRAGRRPVLLGGKRSELAPYGGVSRQVIALHTRGDDSTLPPPRQTAPLLISLWVSEPPR